LNGMIPYLPKTLRYNGRRCAPVCVPPVAYASCWIRMQPNFREDLFHALR
jgi:hypothetical protein